MVKEKYIGLAIGFIFAQIFLAPILELGVEDTGNRIGFLCMGVLGCYLADRWDIILPKLKKVARLRIVIK